MPLQTTEQAQGKNCTFKWLYVYKETEYLLPLFYYKACINTHLLAHAIKDSRFITVYSLLNTTFITLQYWIKHQYVQLKTHAHIYVHSYSMPTNFKLH